MTDISDIVFTERAARINPWSASPRMEGGFYLMHAGRTVAHVDVLDGGALVGRIVGALNRSVGDE